MRPLVFAANWKMHVGPPEAREYLRAFFAAGEIPHERAVWFFPPAVSLEAVAQNVAGHRNVVAGVQDIYWEAKGAYTGEVSAPMLRVAGANAADFQVIGSNFSINPGAGPHTITIHCIPNDYGLLTATLLRR